MDRMVKVYQAKDNFEAHFLKDLLARSGIEAHVVDEHTPYSGVGGIERPRLWVFQADQQRALELLTEYEASRRSAGE